MRTSIWPWSKTSETSFQASDIFALSLFSELNMFLKYCLSSISQIKTLISWVEHDEILLSILQFWLISF